LRRRRRFRRRHRRHFSPPPWVAEAREAFSKVSTEITATIFAIGKTQRKKKLYRYVVNYEWYLFLGKECVNLVEKGQFSTHLPLA